MYSFSNFLKGVKVPTPSLALRVPGSSKDSVDATLFEDGEAQSTKLATALEPLEQEVMKLEAEAASLI